jgi:serine/threonine protein kinase
MELCDGNLTQYVDGKLSTIQKNSSLDRNILRQVALGLSYLHGRDPPIIHKDLKPDNILLKVQKSGQIWTKLTDFGYSREKPADQSGFALTNNLGTCGFVAPELLLKKIPSLATDVWSYGAVFFYVVSNGQQPHDVSGIPMDHLRNYFIEKFKLPPNLSAISSHLEAAELAFNLLNYLPCKRPSIFLVPYHPYFSLSSSTSRLWLTKKVGDFWHIGRKNERKNLEALFSWKSLKQWLEEFDQNSSYWTEEKKEIVDLIQKVLL